MNITNEGLELIRTFEGFRSRAYRDPAGICTIGFGHTSQAGNPPVVEGMEITREEGERILAADVEVFAAGVRKLIRRPLTDRQFSALVSFAYNVGLGNFVKSSVLKAVNAGDLQTAARRLQLWVKAGGKVLPGLVKRRAAEAALLAAEATEDATGMAEIVPSVIQSLKGKSLFGSTTNIAAFITALTGTATALTASFKDIAAVTGGEPVALGLMGILLAASGWIVWERRKKSADDGI
jgi:GH24 family phage-related lysozyme (muramidase)